MIARRREEKHEAPGNNVAIATHTLDQPSGEERLAPVNIITIEPGLVVMPEGAPCTRRLVEQAGVQAIEVAYDEVIKIGGDICCTTMQLVRTPGPLTFE